VENLAESPAHAAVRRDLLARLQAFRTRSRDPWLALETP